MDITALYDRVNKTLKLYIISMIIMCIGIFSSVMIIKDLKVLGAALILCLLSIPVYFITKKKDQYRAITPIMNSIAIGFSIGAFYIYKSINLELTYILLTFIILAALLIISANFTKYYDYNKWIFIISFIICGGILIWCYISWNNNIFLYSNILFSTLLYISYLIALLMAKITNYDLWFIISISHYGAFAVIFILVIALITDSGDGICEILDFDFNSQNRKKAKKV
ncbi:hypothetical protein [Desnuesiella massiliensis]|uniref:hypothetical protein n=1 Tax=Desnuesiella massiliensis TaxID=1650662 RepID=UPI0006E32951|nr:hypothetical protein [Desnuesiella massiliensis]